MAVEARTLEPMLFLTACASADEPSPGGPPDPWLTAVKAGDERL